MTRSLSKLWKVGVAVTCLAAASQSALARPEIQDWTNNAGVLVYFVPIPDLPMVDIRLLFANSGHAHEGDKYGLAKMTASMLHQGAGGMDVDEIADTFSGLGARSSTHAYADSSLVSLRSLTDPQFLDKALETWIKIFSLPDFPKEQFERRRKNVLTGIEGRRQNPGAIAHEAFQKAIYGDHPYAHLGSGTEETVTAMTLDDLRHFYQKHYVTSNLTIAIVGAISRAQAETIADRVTGALKPGEAAAALPPAPELKEAVTIRIPFPSEQAHVKIGQPCIEELHPDIYAIRIGNGIFGGSGFGSRLFEEIRVKRGLAYSARSGIHAPKSTGVFSMSFQTRVDQAEEAADTARKMLREFVASGPTEEEVERALDRTRGGQVFRTNSNGRILSAISNMVYNKHKPDYLYNYILKYEKENRESITAAYQKHVRPDKLVTVIVGGAAEAAE